MKTITHFTARRLTLTLLATLTTITAWAQLGGKGTAAEPYLIESATDWVTFAEQVNNGVGTNSYYKLVNDIALGTAEEPTNIIVGTEKKNFRGNFDGDYHTIYINMYRNDKYAAPFGVTDGATISNLNVDGTITTTNKFGGGFVGYANNGATRTTSLINCISSVHIICDDIVTVDPNKPFDCTHGGLVGQNERGYLSFENCMFKGSITDSKEKQTANKCTGFVGWVNNEVFYNNCIMAGTIDVKANDDDLPNSMANFHRLSKTAKAYYRGNSYFVIDYTYPGMVQQGIQVTTSVPADVISKRFVVNGLEVFIPEAVITDDAVTYCGRELIEGEDYIKKEISEYLTTYEGINNYAGSVTRNTQPVLEMNVDTWDAKTKTGWYAISSPVDGAQFSEVAYLTSAIHNIYRYNEKERLWEEYRDKRNYYYGFENGRGYLYRTMDNGGKIGFRGVANSHDVKYTLSCSKKSDNMNGFNLIGNPYPHEIYKSVAIPNDNLADGYSILNKNGTWRFQNDNTAIPEGVAILVQAINKTKDNNSESIEITMKDTDAAPSAKEEINEIWFSVSNSEYSDVAHIEFSEGNGFHKMAHYNDNAPMLYVRYNDEDFASAVVNGNTKSTSLCFEAKSMGKYTLIIKTNGQFDYLHLLDKLTGKDLNLLVDDEYTFISSNQDNAERFVVKFSYNADNQAIEDKTFAWQNGNDVIVDGTGELQVFDINGRMVMNTIVDGIEAVSITSQGIYVLRLIGEDVKTQKIIIQ